ncbi:OsmC family peroxiredoxin [Ruania zhangjianzhongii]|uniref:OsmC family peroxiredoxin n=1 Tax=Ruania zhangjianzhongii TaxID=2603206 RepID=UPI0011C861B1|nr:OsmC family peroxiredoxin [Ruania zhangjianzhongii]
MPTPVTSSANGSWNGDLTSGSGQTTLSTSGLGTFDVNWKARTEPNAGTTNPEELIAAAHAACYSMALSNELDGNGTTPTSVRTQADVTFVAGTGITGIHLTTVANVPGISEADFARIADGAKDGCPVSVALKATPITLDATLEQ